MYKQVWEMYKASERGKKWIDIFEKAHIRKSANNIGDMFEPFAEDYRIDNEALNDTKNYYINEVIYLYDIISVNTKKYNELFEWLIFESGAYKDSNDKEIASNIYNISSALYIKQPDFFKPILTTKFDVITRNCNILGIKLPPIPLRNNHKSRVLYYYDICEAFEKFQKENNLTSGEFCACLYDYAKLFYEEPKNKPLPAPTNIWLAGCDKSDFDKLDKWIASKDEEILWAGNEGTKKGDIIILYCRSPYSCIHSIWRAKYDGVINPFYYYYCRTYVTQGIKVEPIHFSELKSDAYTSNIPIIRKNLQGIYGVKLTAKDYFEIQRMIKAKGFDTSVLPQPYSPNLDINITINNEKDVEEKLLIPLLVALGYNENDWSRQLSQKAGRGLKAIPDFVFFPYGEKHFQNAPFVLEAKFDMRNMTEKTNAFNQALSYCKMMSASILALCDKERLLIYKKEKGKFDRNNPIFEKYWGAINDNSVFTELKKIIGRDVIERLK